MVVRETHRERTRTREVHRRVAGRVAATTDATRRRPRQLGWSSERDILRIGRRSLRSRFPGATLPDERQSPSDSLEATLVLDDLSPA